MGVSEAQRESGCGGQLLRTGVGGWAAKEGGHERRKRYVGETDHDNVGAARESKEGQARMGGEEVRVLIGTESGRSGKGGRGAQEE